MVGRARNRVSPRVIHVSLPYASRMRVGAQTLVRLRSTEVAAPRISPGEPRLGSGINEGLGEVAGHVGAARVRVAHLAVRCACPVRRLQVGTRVPRRTQLPQDLGSPAQTKRVRTL